MVEKDRIGKRFYQWTVLGEGSRPDKYICRCNCGIVREVYFSNIRRGRSKSCGHLRGIVEKPRPDSGHVDYINKLYPDIYD